MVFKNLPEKDKVEILQKRRNMEYRKRLKTFTTKFVDKNLEAYVFLNFLCGPNGNFLQIQLRDCTSCLNFDI